MKVTVDNVIDIANQMLATDVSQLLTTNEVRFRLTLSSLLDDLKNFRPGKSYSNTKNPLVCRTTQCLAQLSQQTQNQCLNTRGCYD